MNFNFIVFIMSFHMPEELTAFVLLLFWPSLLALILYFWHDYIRPVLREIADLIGWPYMSRLEFMGFMLLCMMFVLLPSFVGWDEVY